MMRACCKWGLALAAACLLAGCDGAGSKGSATPEAATQFLELQAEVEALALADWMAEALPAEMADVVQHFIADADPTYTSSTAKYNILHLACMLKKPELARCLLLDGADANAPTMTEEGAGETPLLYALATDYNPDIPPATINKLIDVLVAGGASLATPGSAETSLTYNACLTCAWEEVYTHLLDIGVPRTGNECAEAAYRGWPNTLQRLLKEKGGIAESDHQLLTVVARMGGGYYDGSHLECARYLLENGVPIDTRDEAGRTALFCLAATLPSLPEADGRREAALELAAYLLQQGADPTLRAEKDQEYPGFSSTDLLALNPDNIRRLKEKGIELATPKVEIRPGDSLPADVCRAAMVHAGAAVIAPHFDTIASLLIPTQQLQEKELYADALKNAICLMALVDAPRTAQLVAASPLWNNSQAAGAHDHTTAALINALQESPKLAIPAELLLSKAMQMLSNGAHEYAASLVELLGRDAANDARIDALCQDERLPIRAGAWGARLYREGLPEACNGAVASWLAAHNRTADTPELKKALLLTSIEDLWYGNMSKETVDAFVAAVNELGAPRAAEAYRAIADNLSNPEKLDEIMTTQELWAYELEIAIAQYLLQHKAAILSHAAN